MWCETWPIQRPCCQCWAMIPLQTHQIMVSQMPGQKIIRLRYVQLVSFLTFISSFVVLLCFIKTFLIVFCFCSSRKNYSFPAFIAVFLCVCFNIISYTSLFFSFNLFQEQQCGCCWRNFFRPYFHYLSFNFSFLFCYLFSCFFVVIHFHSQHKKG